MISNIPQMVTMEISLQVSSVGNSKMFRLLLLKDGDGCEGVDMIAMVNEWVNRVKTGGYFTVHDLRTGGSIVDVSNTPLEFPTRPAQSMADKVIPPPIDEGIVVGRVRPDTTRRPDPSVV